MDLGSSTKTTIETILDNLIGRFGQKFLNCRLNMREFPFDNKESACNNYQATLHLTNVRCKHGLKIQIDYWIWTN